MTSTSKAAFAYPAALLAFSALAACGEKGSNTGNAANGASAAPAAPTGQLFSDAFKGVCSGASVSRAAAYDPAAPSHKALYFATYRDDFSERSTELPADWTVRWSPNGNALTAIDLVVCARRVADRQVRVCDNYQNDGRPTQNQVRWHTATYELSVREAHTGRELAKTTVEATSDICPMLMSFNDDSETVDAYASPSDSAVADFLRPHITHDQAAAGPK